MSLSLGTTPSGGAASAPDWRSCEVAVASVAWDIPGLDSRHLLADAFRGRAGAPPAEAETGSDAVRLRAACTAALERAGLGELKSDRGLAGVLIGDGPEQWPTMRDSFAALMHAVQAIECGQAQRMLVCGVLRLPPDAGHPDSPCAGGAVAVLLEAQSCLAARLPMRSWLTLVDHAEARACEDGGARVLGLLERHADKPLYVSVESSLRPALAVMANLHPLRVVDLGADVPPDAGCQCLLQLVALFERHACGCAPQEPGAVFAGDGSVAGGPTGIFVVAPAGDAPVSPWVN